MKYKLTALFVVFTLVFTLFISSTIIASLPSGPLSFSKNVQANINSAVFQSWGFFSKDPRDKLLNAHSLNPDEEILWPNNRTKNLFGLKRLGRKQGIELGTIYSKVPTDQYKECKERLEKCTDNIVDEDVFNVENEHPTPTICGLWIITHTDPIPWSWGKAEEPVDMPSEVVKVDIKCLEK